MRKSDVETNNLNRLSRAAIDTQFEMGILLARLIVRDSPYLFRYEEKFAKLFYVLRLLSSLARRSFIEMSQFFILTA